MAFRTRRYREIKLPCGCAAVVLPTEGPETFGRHVRAHLAELQDTALDGVFSDEPTGAGVA